MRLHAAAWTKKCVSDSLYRSLDKDVLDPDLINSISNIFSVFLLLKPNQASTLELEAHPALDKLTSKISTLNLERVRQIKSRLVAITGRVQKVE